MPSFTVPPYEGGTKMVGTCRNAKGSEWHEAVKLFSDLGKVTPYTVAAGMDDVI